MKRFVGRTLLFVSLFAAGCAALTAAAEWPPQTDLPLDTAVTAGTLPNGLRYAVRPNQEPRGRVSLRLLVRAGSLDETETERGLAHYLEHMAFNGTRDYPTETALIEFFQRQGMSFGGDSNASTGFENTMYLLELAHNDEATVREGLKVFQNFADGMLIDGDEVAKERGIIFSEKRARDSVEFRTALAEYAFILPDTLIPARWPIGIDETLNGANRERLDGFYRRWYRPDNMAVVIVGDIDPAATVELIKTAFSPLTASGELPARADRGRVVPVTQPEALVHREVEASTVTIAFDVTSPYTKQPDSVAERLRDLPRGLAHAMLNRRLERLAKKENAPFTHASAGASDNFDFVTVASLEITGTPDRWRESLAVGEQELRRALQFGFAPAELQEITASSINGLEEEVRSAATRRSSGLASALAAAIENDTVFTTPETDLAIARPALEQVTVDDCLAALRQAWAVAAPRLFVSGRLAETDTKEDVLATFQQSMGVAVAPPEDITTTEFAYTDFGPAGEVVSREHVEDLDLTLVRFANGVRLNLKRTDFQANTINLSARLGGGTLELPLDRPELARVAGPLLNEGGLGQHDEDELQRILAGRSVGLGFGIGEDAFSFGGRTSPKDLELELQLLCAYLTDPGLREDVLPRIRKSIEQNHERMLHVPGGIVQLQVRPLLASGDPRFVTPPVEKQLAVTPADVRAWLTPILQRGALEVAIVGDIDIDQTIAFAARTLGALPKRDEKPAFAAARVVKFPTPSPSATLPVDTEIPKSLVLVFWPTTDNHDIQRTRRLGLLAEVLGDRLRKVVREKLGAAYSPNAQSSMSETYPGYGLLYTAVEVAPDQATIVTDAILELAEELRTSGITEDELQRTREPLLTSIRESWRQNNYWLGSVLSHAQEKPQYLEYSRNRQADFESITVADLNALAAEYLIPEKAAKFIVEPVAPPAGAP